MSFKELNNRTIILRYKPVLTAITIDQTKLPNETIFLNMKTCEDVAKAIKTMKIRGAPLLGAAAAFALALKANNSTTSDREELMDQLRKASLTLKKTRPTAVNLFWAIDRILEKAQKFLGDTQELVKLIIKEAQKIADEDAKANHVIGEYGAELFSNGDIILTHCNAGALATVAYGTALGVIKAAWNKGKKIKVFATETRPKLQGARLTAYELKREGIPFTLITDNMVGYMMYKYNITKVIVGADRIVQDAVINKIGTYSIAVLAKEHFCPFYVAAPTSTFDLTHSSNDVQIEQRSTNEVTDIGSMRITPKNVNVLNPAFDITPMKYVTSIICENGILNKDDLATL